MKIRDLIILGVLWAFISIFAPDETTTLPLFPVVLVALLLIYGAGDKWWQALKYEGDHCFVDLKRDSGHTIIHPEDLRDPIGRNGETFRTMATGGFVAGGFSWNGSDNFFVFPPEHLEKFPKGIVVHTNFHRVSFNSLPDYIQQDLMKLHFFSPAYVERHQNLWFGMTSKKLGTATEKNLHHEVAWLEENAAINDILAKLREKPKEGPKPYTWESDF